MRIFSLTILIILLTCNYLYGQASWSFSVWFNLYDKEGVLITPKVYEEKNIKLYSFPFGAHSNNRFTYDTLSNSFKFSQHTITTVSLLVFVIASDTVTIEISTKNTFITRLDLINGIYNLCVWGNEEKFNCKFIGQSKTSACFNKLNFSDYQTTRNRKINIKDLEAIELK